MAHGTTGSEYGATEALCLNFSSVTDIYPRFKLIRLIPNWDNLRQHPFSHNRKLGRYQCLPLKQKCLNGNLQSYISSDLMYSQTA